MDHESLSGKKLIERKFADAYKSWMSLSNYVATYNFNSVKEEIFFFKNLKPMITS